MIDLESYTPVTRGNPASWIGVLWAVLDAVDLKDVDHDEACTAMAWITEDLELPTET